MKNRMWPTRKIVFRNAKLSGGEKNFKNALLEFLWRRSWIINLLFNSTFMRFRWLSVNGPLCLGASRHDIILASELRRRFDRWPKFSYSRMRFDFMWHATFFQCLKSEMQVDSAWRRRLKVRQQIWYAYAVKRVIDRYCQIPGTPSVTTDTNLSLRFAK